MVNDIDTTNNTVARLSQLYPSCNIVQVPNMVGRIDLCYIYDCVSSYNIDDSYLYDNIINATDVYVYKSIQVSKTVNRIYMCIGKLENHNMEII